MCWEISLFLAPKPLRDSVGETSVPLFSLQLVLAIPWAQLSATAWTLCLDCYVNRKQPYLNFILDHQTPPGVLWGDGVVLISGVPDCWAEVLPSMSWGLECPSCAEGRGAPFCVHQPLAPISVCFGCCNAIPLTGCLINNKFISHSFGDTETFRL